MRDVLDSSNVFRRLWLVHVADLLWPPFVVPNIRFDFWEMKNCLSQADFVQNPSSHYRPNIHFLITIFDGIVGEAGRDTVLSCLPPSTQLEVDRGEIGFGIGVLNQFRAI